MEFLSIFKWISALFTIAPAAISPLHLSTQVGLNALDWKVGDTEVFKLEVGTQHGSFLRQAVREEGNGIWVHEHFQLSFISDQSDYLFDRATGQVMKYIHNGDEEELPNPDFEVIDMVEEDVVVPAGTFKTMHVSGKSSQVEKQDFWIDPVGVPLGGIVKVYVKQPNADLTLSLMEFEKK